MQGNIVGITKKMLHVTCCCNILHTPPLYFNNNNNIYILYIYIIIKRMYIRGRVCVKGCATMRPETYLYIFPCTFRLFLLPLQYKWKQQPKHINPTNPKVMIIKHLQGGGNRLLLPPSMQCVARVALPAILFAMTVCLSSCAMQKV